MLETLVGNKFKYTKLTPEEQKERGILGTLYGPIADTKNPTRNGRLYPREAWEKAISDPLFQEALENKTVFAELEHPYDREEIDPREACAILAGEPVIGDDGMLYGEFHILDLPNGRILKTLCDYGTTIGVSSRGTGDLVEDINGNSSVEPDSFDLTCWDVVITPALKAARMNYVKESLGNKTLTESLKELVDNANSDNKKIMEKTIDVINQKLNEGINTQKSDNINKVVEIGETNNEKVEVVDNESKSLVKSLTEALTSKATLEKKLQELQEKLAVSDAKVNSLEKEVDNYKKTSISLSKRISEVKGLKQENQSLKEQLENQKIELAGKNSNISILREKLNDSKKTNITLNESTSEKDSKLVKLQEELSSAKNEIKELNEKLNKSINNVDVKKLEQELSKKDKLVESCRKNIKTVVNKYIESKAVALGVKSNEITNRLNENFTLEDVDKVCEDLQQYNLRIGQLPFNVNSSRIRVTESKGSRYEPKQVDIADDVDDLVRLADSFN